MKKAILFVMLALFVSVSQAKGLSPAEQEVAAMQTSLKEKKAALKAEKKKQQIIKAQVAYEKAKARLEKLQAE